MNSQPFITRLQRGKVRQFALSGISLFVAALFVYFTSPKMIGGFAYYTIVLLLALNALMSLLQFQHVIRPIIELLTHMSEVADQMKRDDGEQVDRFGGERDDAFGCLAAGVDNVLENVFEQLTAARDRQQLLEEILTATPLAMVVLTREGKVARLFNANGLGDALPSFRIGESPRADFWGEESVRTFERLQSAALYSPDPQWAVVTAGEGRAARRFRVCIRRMNEMSTLLTALDVTDRLGQDRRGSSVANAAGLLAAQRSALRRMAASIAHDGRNVFAALSNLVEMNRESTDAAVRRQVPLAEDAIARGTRLLGELQGFAGETRMQLRCVDASEAIGRIANSPTIQAILPENVRLHVDVAAKLPKIDLDAEQFWKVFMNLAKNAVEALHGQRGRLTIRAAAHDLTPDEADGYRHSETLRTGDGVLITVADDGPGIPGALITRLFEPYASSKGEGRGIGLATVMTIIDAHGGAIAAKSSHGRGTAFSIFLPASRNTDEELAMIRKVAPNGEILLVDDDEMILHTTSLVLRTLGIAAHPSSTVNDAMTKLLALRSRLRAVLVDADIGGVSSAQFVQTVRNDFPGIPVIVVSGAPQDKVDAVYAGVAYDRFISKPYSVDDLRQVLDEVARS